MIIQIEDKLTVIKAAKDANDRTKYDDLLTLFYNSFALTYTLTGTVKPSNCNGDILSFMNNVISERPTWVKPDHKQKYINTLQNKEVVAIIGEVQKKINEKGLFKVGGGAFIQKTHHIHPQIHQTQLQPQQPPQQPPHRQKIKIKYNISQMKYCIYAKRRRRRTSRKPT